ncbi:type VII secretion target [Mycolicibacterium houstonense]|uniref:type VII secretion target n=1 Tax=Mycolicibacterium houstonense TaxID=146021 RepID=UPI00082AC5AE|nr:type VII secretion target [Mycolicibacterium houstonense]
MSDELQVDPDALTSAGAAFREAGSALGALQLDVPLNTAAGGVNGLQTASACRAAGSALAERTAAAAADATSFGSNLDAAVAKYRATDSASGNTVAGAMTGG